MRYDPTHTHSHTYTLHSKHTQHTQLPPPTAGTAFMIISCCQTPVGLKIFSSSISVQRIHTRRWNEYDILAFNVYSYFYFIFIFQTVHILWKCYSRLSKRQYENPATDPSSFPSCSLLLTWSCTVSPECFCLTADSLCICLDVRATLPSGWKSHTHTHTHTGPCSITSSSCSSKTPVLFAAVCDSGKQWVMSQAFIDSQRWGTIWEMCCVVCVNPSEPPTSRKHPPTLRRLNIPTHLFHSQFSVLSKDSTIEGKCHQLVWASYLLKHTQREESRRAVLALE